MIKIKIKFQGLLVERERKTAKIFSTVVTAQSKNAEIKNYIIFKHYGFNN